MLSTTRLTLQLVEILKANHFSANESAFDVRMNCACGAVSRSQRAVSPWGGVAWSASGVGFGCSGAELTGPPAGVRGCPADRWT